MQFELVNKSATKEIALRSYLVKDLKMHSAHVAARLYAMPTGTQPMGRDATLHTAMSRFPPTRQVGVVYVSIEYSLHVSDRGELVDSVCATMWINGRSYAAFNDDSINVVLKGEHAREYMTAAKPVSSTLRAKTVGAVMVAARYALTSNNWTREMYGIDRVAQIKSALHAMVAAYVSDLRDAWHECPLASEWRVRECIARVVPPGTVAIAHGGLLGFAVARALALPYYTHAHPAAFDMVNAY